MHIKNIYLSSLISLTIVLVACEMNESSTGTETIKSKSMDQNQNSRITQDGRMATPEEVRHLLSLPLAQADGGLAVEKDPSQIAPLAKSSAFPLPACTIDFNSSNALMFILDHGYSTFIVSPWYAEQCYGDYWIRGTAVNISHWHLVAEAANQCFGTSPKWGTQSGANCINQTDAMYWPRKAMNMNGNTGISFKAVYQDGTYRHFDLQALYVRSGTVKVLAYRVGIGWWYWPNLTAGHRWHWTVNNLNISDVRVFDTNEEGTFAIDNLEVAIYP